MHLIILIKPLFLTTLMFSYSKYHTMITQTELLATHISYEIRIRGEKQINQRCRVVSYPRQFIICNRPYSDITLSSLRAFELGFNMSQLRSPIKSTGIFSSTALSIITPKLSIHVD